MYSPLIPPADAGLDPSSLKLIVSVPSTYRIDVGMLCAAHALADRGEADILAVIHDTGLPVGI